MLVRRRTKDNPNRIFAILDIGNNAVARPIFGLHLIAHIRSEHLQSRMCAAVLASEIGQKRDSQIWPDGDGTGRPSGRDGRGISHCFTSPHLRQISCHASSKLAAEA
jgi:hypothetical protein